MVSGSAGGSSETSGSALKFGYIQKEEAFCEAKPRAVNLQAAAAAAAFPRENG